MGPSEPSDLNCSAENESPTRMRKSLLLFACCFTGAEEGEREGNWLEGKWHSSSSPGIVCGLGFQSVLSAQGKVLV